MYYRRWKSAVTIVVLFKYSTSVSKNNKKGVEFIGIF